MRESRRQAKRAALFAEHLVEQELTDVLHRHVVFTVPGVVRESYERERRLLVILPRRAHESMQLSWQHSGFHVHAAEPVLPEDAERLEHSARYVARAPVRPDAITPFDAARVVVCMPPDSQKGIQRVEIDVLDMIRRLCAQIPAPRQHLVRRHRWYSHRARGVRGEGAKATVSEGLSTARGCVGSADDDISREDRHATESRAARCYATGSPRTARTPRPANGYSNR